MRYTWFEMSKLQDIFPFFVKNKMAAKWQVDKLVKHDLIVKKVQKQGKGKPDLTWVITTEKTGRLLNAYHQWADKNNIDRDKR